MEERSKFSRNNNKTSFSNIPNKDPILKQTVEGTKLHSESMKDCKNAEESRVRSSITDSSSPFETSHDNDANSSEDRKFLETNHQPIIEEENIELIYCNRCGKSYAPETSKKFCQTFDEEGNPKCLRLKHKKRKAFNSAKVMFSIKKLGRRPHITQ